MGCLLAEFKLTAMLYGGRREGTTAFWVSPLCTPPLNISFSLFLSFLPLSASLYLVLSLTLSLSHRRNLERLLDPGVLSGGQLTRGSWKISLENILSRLKTIFSQYKYKVKVSSYC